MRLFRPFAFAVVTATLCGVLHSFAQEANSAKPATIWYTEQFTVHSRAVGSDFLIQVARPVKPQAGKVPVIYLLDGNSLFGEAADMVTSYGYFGDTAAAYVVGIGYPTRDFGQWLSLRNRDLLHVRIPDKLAAGSGGGAQFEKFLGEELRPLIERRYPVDPHRSILAGHSFGGLFVSHVLLTAPSAFNGYLICSPSLWAETNFLQEASSFHTPVPLKIFIGVGGKEEEQFGQEARMVKNAEDFAARLNNHDSGAEVKFVEYPGQTHGTVIPAFFSQALSFMLPAPAAAASQ